MDKLLDILKKVCKTGFYGEVVIKFEDGKVKWWKKTEMFKP